MHPEPGSGSPREPSQPDRTPSTDMQPEDAGTPESGNTQDTGRGNAADPGRGTSAEPALKQTDKTDQETGSRG